MDRENVPDPTPEEVDDAARQTPKGHPSAGRVLEQEEEAKQEEEEGKK
jgi:hypothetical protein